jgi:hypothetical protein
MKPVQTKLSNETIEQIEATGKSVYSFLQEAVESKLRGERVKSSELIITQAMKEHQYYLENLLDSVRVDNERSFAAKMAEMEERLLAVVGISQKLLSESIAKDEGFREKILENLRKISGAIRGGQ